MGRQSLRVVNSGDSPEPAFHTCYALYNSIQGAACPSGFHACNVCSGAEQIISAYHNARAGNIFYASYALRGNGAPIVKGIYGLLCEGCYRCESVGINRGNSLDKPMGKLFTASGVCTRKRPHSFIKCLYVKSGVKGLSKLLRRYKPRIPCYCKKTKIYGIFCAGSIGQKAWLLRFHGCHGLLFPARCPKHKGQSLLYG
jgi:hypothetical protein